MYIANDINILKHDFLHGITVLILTTIIKVAYPNIVIVLVIQLFENCVISYGHYIALTKTSVLAN